MLSDIYKYVFKKLIIFIIVIIAATFLVFFIMHNLPGETVINIIKYDFLGDVTLTPTNNEINFIKEKYNLNQPLYEQYLSWMNGVLHGNLGQSIQFNIPVLTLIEARFPATILLTFISIVISVIIGVTVGIISATHKNSITDYFCNLGILIGKSIPSFWLALVLILIFSMKFNLTPVVGYGGIEYWVLPVITLSASVSPVFARLMRSSLLEVLEQDYIRTAKGKGLDKNTIVYRHAIKNAMLPLVTMTGLMVGHLLGGVLIIEQIFAWPGMGKLLLDAIEARDIPLVQGCILIFILIFLSINFCIDLIYPLLDPRIMENT